ncbi:MAG: chemotaxis response regulator protein-glutamate methylesterase [Gammaproteobacteria bacterium]
MLDADSHIEVVGTAANGREALASVPRLKPDVITMDIEMPVMDGIAAVREIMSHHPTPIMMFSSLTTAGAQATLEALDAGAVDFLPKNLDDMAVSRELAKRQLCARVRMIGARGLKRPPRPAPRHAAAAHRSSRPAAAPVLPYCDLSEYQLLLIGTSTGGPAALQDVLSKLPRDFPLPIVMVQHMPASFTPPFAQRLNGLCRITVKHAENGDVLRPGTAYLAPGGFQMLLEREGEHCLIRIASPKDDETYRPSVDVTFSSAARAVKGKTLALILTGMGADGREGARLLKERDSTIWVQDEASCVVAGMPSAVIDAGLADAILPLNQIASALMQGT